MNPNTIEIPVIAWHQDLGDGSSSVTFFNNRDELTKQLEDDGEDLTVEEIESEDDPFENGILTDETISLEFVPDLGTYKLAQSFTTTAG